MMCSGVKKLAQAAALASPSCLSAARAVASAGMSRGNTGAALFPPPCNSGYIDIFRTWLHIVIPMQSPIEWKFMLISIRCDTPPPPTPPNWATKRTSVCEARSSTSAATRTSRGPSGSAALALKSQPRCGLTRVPLRRGRYVCHM